MAEITIRMFGFLEGETTLSKALDTIATNLSQIIYKVIIQTSYADYFHSSCQYFQENRFKILTRELDKEFRQFHEHNFFT